MGSILYESRTLSEMILRLLLRRNLRTSVSVGVPVVMHFISPAVIGLSRLIGPVTVAMGGARLQHAGAYGGKL